ncbi:MAG: GNAT family N-acetyltransferase [Ruminococcaceae bacterium]|nr:GNAT family N-acetyltransferase [Oscillospiraceae bacterium]
MEIIVKTFHQLTTDELYEILKIRCAVFVVEQNCPYQDIDGTDKRALHLFLKDENGDIVSYLRIFEKDENTAQIGRVVTAVRRKGYGTQLLKEAMVQAKQHFGKSRIYLEAQTYALPFYSAQGFVPFGEEFLEDGIPHIRMKFEFQAKA